MALFKSQVLTQASGSVGGLTYSHAKGGMYMRARSTPVNPNTAQQQVVRQAQSLLSQMWQTTLSDEMRSEWNVYSANVARRNRVGDTIHLSGIAMFTRCNVPRVQAGLPVVQRGPATFTLGDAPELVSVTQVSANGSPASMTLDVPEPGLEDVSLLIYVSRPISPTVTFFNGPFRFNSAVTPSSGAQFSFPLNPALIQQTITPGNDFVVRARISYPDGRLSDASTLRVRATITFPQAATP